MRSIAVGAFAAIIAAQSATPALAADPLKIGVLMPTSGVFAVLGQRQLNGMRFAVEEAGGEVAGRKIEMLHEDSEGKPDVGLAKARKLVLSDRVDVMAGIINSAVALAVAPYLSSQRMPLVISNASTDLLSGREMRPLCVPRFVFEFADHRADRDVDGQARPEEFVRHGVRLCRAARICGGHEKGLPRRRRHHRRRNLHAVQPHAGLRPLYLAGAQRQSGRRLCGLFRRRGADLRQAI